MIALINTFDAIQGNSIGIVVSLHRNVNAAQEANTKLQRAVRKANGQNSYLPTRIVRLTERRAAGVHVGLSGFEPLTEDEIG